jgi:hypothetical protein
MSVSELNPYAQEYIPNDFKHIAESVANAVLLDDFPENFINWEDVPIYTIKTPIITDTYYDVEFSWFTKTKNINTRRAMFQLYKNGIPLKGFNYSDSQCIEYAIKGLTSSHMGLFYPSGKPIKKYYNVYTSICSIIGIDDTFRRRFADPEKRWRLKMEPSAVNNGWVDIEVSFIM